MRTPSSKAEELILFVAREGSPVVLADWVAARIVTQLGRAEKRRLPPTLAAEMTATEAALPLLVMATVYCNAPAGGRGVLVVVGRRVRV